MKKFDEFRFKGFDFKNKSNNYYECDQRISSDNNKIILKVAKEQLLRTEYGYAYILDRHHVVFLKKWQVSMNFYGNEVLLDKEFFNVKEWGNFENFLEDENLDWNEQYKTAEEQQKANNKVRWAK